MSRVWITPPPAERPGERPPTPDELARHTYPTGSLRAATLLDRTIDRIVLKPLRGNPRHRKPFTA